MANKAKQGDLIKWNGETMQSDEKLSPTFEDMILLIVLGLVDPRLPEYVKSHYAPKMEDSRLMDFKTDIFTNVEQIDTMEQFSTFKVESPNLAAFNKFKQNRGASNSYQNRGASNSYQKHFRPNKTALNAVFCKPCWPADKGKDVYRTHNKWDKKCPTKNKLSNIHGLNKDNVIEEELQDLDTSPGIQEEVSATQYTYECPHCVTAGLGFLQPVPTQLLTLQDSGGTLLTLELDSAATVNYVSDHEAQSRNFLIRPYTQVSRLGDGKTLLPACGEINKIFYRNDFEVSFRALVVKSLHCGFIGGTLFIKDNHIRQDFNKNTISLLNGRHKVMTTVMESTFPIKPTASILSVKLTTMNPPAVAPMEKPSVKMKSAITTTTMPEMKVTRMVTSKSSPLIFIKESKIIMPGDYKEQKVNDLHDGSIVLAEGHEANTWIRPQLRTIRGGMVLLQNKKADPVFLSKNKKSVVKLTPTKLVDINDPETDNNYYNGPNRTMVYKTDEDNLAEI